MEENECIEGDANTFDTLGLHIIASNTIHSVRVNLININLSSQLIDQI